MRAPTVEHRTVRAPDGTVVAYQVAGEGPAVVLANGLGGTYTTWRHQFALLEGYKLISWDYRGLFRSGRPPRLESVALDQQAEDLACVLEQEGVDRALFMGWSMGVQYNFEYFRRHGHQFAGLVALNGTAGMPFSTAFPGLPVNQIVKVLVGAMKLSGPLISASTRLAGQAHMAVPVLQLLGLAADTLDEDVLVDLVQEYTTMDFEAYAETLLRLGLHDATDLLPRVDIPTLVITGTKDLFTPLATSQEMARLIPDARLHVVEGGTHYTAVEFPDQVNGYIRDFINDLGYGRLGSCPRTTWPEAGEALPKQGAATT